MFFQFAITTGTFNGFPPQAALLLLLSLKVLFIIAAILYLIFAFMVVRQIQVMKGTVITPFSPVVQLIGFLHLLLALVSVLAAALLL